jgi:hypothetical protein
LEAQFFGSSLFSLGKREEREKNMELRIPSLGRGWDRLPKVAQKR